MTTLDHKLSKNFAFGELTRTGHLDLQAPNREAAEAYLQALTALASTLLQPIRDHFGALRITSGFRSKAVNQRIKGSKASEHLLGQAVDFVPLSEGVELDEVFDWIRTSDLPYGQVIHEAPTATSQWIHLSLGSPWRKSDSREALRFDGRRYVAAR